MNITEQLESALRQTISLLKDFPGKSLNTKPATGGWSGAQAIQHLYLSEKDMAQLLAMPAPSTDRNPEERAAEFKSILLDFDRKMDAPPFLVPEEKQYDKPELIKLLEDLIAPILEAVRNNNLNQVPDLGEGHPLNGSTKLELVHFAAYHTIRHNRQIEKIKEQV